MDKGFISHFEDIAILKGKSCISDILEIFDALNKNKKDSFLLSEKIDGSVAIFFGITKKGEFFISTKTKIFKKEPLLFKSKKEINEAYKDTEGAEVVEKLKIAFDYLPEILNEPSVYCGDFLFSSNSKKETSKGVYFKPNTIEYLIPKDSPFYEKAKRAKLGIAIHSKFSINEKNEISRISFDTNGLGESDNVFWVHPYIEEFIDIQINKKEVKKMLEEFIEGIDNSFWNFLNKQTVKELFLKYTVEKGDGLKIQNLEGFFEWVESKEKFSKKLKKEIKNQDVFSLENFLNMIEYLIVLKNSILDHLYGNLQKKVGETLFKGKEFPVEGYVVNYKNGIVKFVDRETFTKTNKENRE